MKFLLGIEYIQNIYALTMKGYIYVTFLPFSLCVNQISSKRIKRCASSLNFLIILKNIYFFSQDSSAYKLLITLALTIGVLLALCHMVHWFKIGKLQWTVFIVCSFTLSLHLGLQNTSNVKN